MEVKTFNNKEHLPTLLSWLVQRKAYIPTPEELPGIGFISFDGDEAIAAVFLRRIEGGHGLIDGLTSNPNKSPEVRNSGIDLVLKSLMKSAQILKMRNILAFTEYDNLVERMETFGFSKLHTKFIICDLDKNTVEKATATL